MNLLLSEAELGIFSGSVDGPIIVMEAVGVYSGYPASKVFYTDSYNIPPASSFAATFTWDIDTVADTGYVWLVVVDDDVVVYQQLLNDQTGPSTGSGSFDVPVTVNPYISICADPESYNAPPISYGVLGSVTLIATAGVVPEPEPVETPLPWWYCAPKVSVVCPTRETSFVPFSDYDADFKFPVASSRVPSKIKLEEGCTTCAPTIIVAPQ